MIRSYTKLIGLLGFLSGRELLDNTKRLIEEEARKSHSPIIYIMFTEQQPK